MPPLSFRRISKRKALAETAHLPLGLQSFQVEYRKIIRLDYLPCWFLAGLLFERLLLENEPASASRRLTEEKDVDISPPF